MASLSYPGFFTTRKIGNTICVDGGVVNPLPFNLIKNVDYLIIIDVSKETHKIDEDSNIKDIVLQSTLAMQRTIVEKTLESCKIPYTIITPDVESHGVLNFEDITDLTKKGETSATKCIDKIKKDIKELDKK